MKKIILAIFLIALGLMAMPNLVLASATWWDFQSIDTMKYSRDTAREKLNDSSFDAVIDQQVSQIASTGATHVALATPYDEEFVPFLSRWVKAARKYNLHVWFRGNWSGWEGWFDYPKITRAQHLQKTRDFITKHTDLIQNGDVFSPCPECENGGPGDPRGNGDVNGHRQFLIDEYRATADIFRNQGKDVRTNFNSMNGDVARLVMDPETTKSLGGIVVIDHYVPTPEKLAADIANIARVSGGKIVLGEYGVPIPGIHPSMNDTQQAAWLSKSLELLTAQPDLVGINYWVSTGGSTQLWNENGTARMAATTVKTFFAPASHQLAVKNALHQPVASARVQFLNHTFFADTNGVIAIPNSTLLDIVKVSAPGYLEQSLKTGDTTVSLVKTNPSWWFRLQDLIYRLLGVYNKR